jgi:hypothetical protein
LKGEHGKVKQKSEPNMRDWVKRVVRIPFPRRTGNGHVHSPDAKFPEGLAAVAAHQAAG